MIVNARLRQCIRYSSTAMASCTTRIQELMRVGYVTAARQMFDEMPNQDPVAWNSIIFGYFQNGIVDEARRMFDSFTGKNVWTWTIAVSGYAKNGQVEEARCLFDEMPDRNIVSWNAMISGYVENGDIPEARRLFERMPQRNSASWNAMITAYCHSRQMNEARRLFDRMDCWRSILSWTVMISRYVENINFEEAWAIFRKMIRSGAALPDTANFLAAISAVSSLNDIKLVENLQALAVKIDLERDVVVGTAILNEYVKLTSGIDSAIKFFSWMPEKNEYSWSTMIAALSQVGRLEYALYVYDMDPEKSAATQTAMMAGLLQNGRIREARLMFDEMPNPVTASWNAIIAGYAQCGMFDEAEELFCRMPTKNAISWAAMIAGYAQNGRNEDALLLLQQMHNFGMLPNASSFTSGFLACTNLSDLETGQQLHSLAIKSGSQFNAFINNGLITMYSKCRNVGEVGRIFGRMRNRDIVSWNSLVSGLSQNSLLEDAVAVFEKMPHRDVVSWTAIISAFAQADNGCQAAKLFLRMLGEGLLPNTSTTATLLSVSGNLGAQRLGKQIHSMAVKLGHDLDCFVGNALITMYFKCEGPMESTKVFFNMPGRDIITWNAMLVGCAEHGYGAEAVEIFEQMKAEGVAANRITFLGLLCACSHAGLVNEGWRYFKSMSRNHGVVPMEEHYACMVDLLGRAGRLYEAEEFIEKMPIEPDSVVWSALLGACRIHHNAEIGRRVAERLFDMEPHNASNYILLSNIYAARGMWVEVEGVREMMRERGVAKDPGCSWTQMKKKMVRSFINGDERRDC